eukprot:543238-Pelagomonas_calceolata.AAC.1
MTNVPIANFRTVKIGRTKGNSRLCRSLKEETSVLVLKSNLVFELLGSSFGGEGLIKVSAPRMTPFLN